MNPSKDKGTRRETAAARWLAAHGWPECERQPLRGNRDQGDLIVSRAPRIIAEVKTRKGTISTGQITEWLQETETEAVHAGADLAVLVVARHGVRVPSWDAYMPAADWLLVLAGVAVLPSDGPWPMRVTLSDWSEIVRAWAEGL